MTEKITMTKKSTLYQGCNMFSLNERTNYKNHYTGGLIVPPLPPDPSKPTMSFNLNFKTNEEVWYGTDYSFTMDRDELLMNSTVSRRAKRIQKYGIVENPPRPLNSFFLYAKNENNKSDYKNMRAKDRLKKIKERWKSESKETKELFDCGANLAKERHAKLHKGYQFTRKTRQKKQNTIVNIEDNSFIPSKYSSKIPITSSFSSKEHSQNIPPYFQFNDNTLQIPIEKYYEQTPPTEFLPTSIQTNSIEFSVYDLPANYNQIESSISSNLELMMNQHNQHSDPQVESILDQYLLNSAEFLTWMPLMPYIQPETNFITNLTNDLSMNEILSTPKISIPQDSFSSRFELEPNNNPQWIG